MVQALVEDGVRIACLDQPGADFSAVERVCSSAGVPHGMRAVDARDRDEVFAAAGEAARLGHARYAVNCAAVDSPGDAESVTTPAWERVVDIDLNGVFYSCQAEYDVMRDHGGAIVNVASMSGHIVNRDAASHVAYGAAKAGVSHFSRSLGVEWIKRGSGSTR